MLTTKEIKNLAVEWVMEFERHAGRRPQDVRQVANTHADIYSAPRTIEVMAVGKSERGAFVWLEVDQVEEVRRNPDFHLYVVENTAPGDAPNFRLTVLTGERLARLLDRAKVVSGDRLARLAAKARASRLGQVTQKREVA